MTLLPRRKPRPGRRAWLSLVHVDPGSPASPHVADHRPSPGHPSRRSAARSGRRPPAVSDGRARHRPRDRAPPTDGEGQRHDEQQIRRGKVPSKHFAGDSTCSRAPPPRHPHGWFREFPKLSCSTSRRRRVAASDRRFRRLRLRLCLQTARHALSCSARNFFAAAKSSFRLRGGVAGVRSCSLPGAPVGSAWVPAGWQHVGRGRASRAPLHSRRPSGSSSAWNAGEPLQLAEVSHMLRRGVNQVLLRRLRRALPAYP